MPGQSFRGPITRVDLEHRASAAGDEAQAAQLSPARVSLVKEYRES